MSICSGSIPQALATSSRSSSLESWVLGLMLSPLATWIPGGTQVFHFDVVIGFDGVSGPSQLAQEAEPRTSKEESELAVKETQNSSHRRVVLRAPM